MKRLISLSILILFVNIGIAQENINWVDSILTKVILNEIKVFNNNFKVLKNSEIKLVSRDTVVNGVWSRPKYLNNILQESFDGVLIESQIVFDTSTNKKNIQYIDFKYPQFDVNGNFLKDIIEFTISKKGLSVENKNINSTQINNLKNTKWINNKIIVEGKKIGLDSCHKIFKLVFNEDFTFTQEYGNNLKSCSTQFMEKDKEVGVEGNTNDFIKYHNKIQGHYLNTQKGIWKIEKNNLLLIYLDEKRILSFRIKKMNKKKLHLSFDASNYLIKMKEANR